MGAIRALCLFGLANLPVIALSQVDPYSLISSNQTISNQLGANSQIWEVVSGNRHTFGGGQLVPSGNIPVGGSTISGAGTVKPHEPINLSGWQRAGNFGVAADATGVTVGSTVNVDKVGSVRPTSPVKMTVKAPISAAAVATGIAAGALRTIPQIGGAILIGSAFDALFQKMDVQEVKSGPNGLEGVKVERTQSVDKACVNSLNGGGYLDELTRCKANTGPGCRIEYFPNGHPGYGVNAKCVVWNDPAVGGPWTYGPAIDTQTASENRTPINQQQIAQEIEDYLKNPSTTTDAQRQKVILDAIAKAVEQGVTFPTGQPTVTGPATVQGQPRVETSTGTQTGTQTGPQTQTQTTTKTTTDTAKLTYSGNSYTYNITTSSTTNVTNNTTNNETNTTTSTTNTTTQETDKPEEDPSDPCTENPDRVGCMKVDVPDGEIPKKNKEVTYNAETWGGSGSCPANVVLWQRGGHQAVLPIEDICPYLATYVRGLIIALSLFSAFLIVLPGETRV